MFIDEACNLTPREGDAFLKEAVGQLLSNLTHPKYAGKMIVLIAGYTAEIDALLNSNPGMIR